MIRTAVHRHAGNGLDTMMMRVIEDPACSDYQTMMNPREGTVVRSALGGDILMNADLRGADLRADFLFLPSSTALT